MTNCKNCGVEIRVVHIEDTETGKAWYEPQHRWIDGAGWENYSKEYLNCTTPA